MSRISAGLLMYRTCQGRIEVLLAHPGGPYFRNKDEGAWTIPKGEVEPEEDLLETAQREFTEETGLKPHGPFLPLATVKQKGGKIVHAWAFEGNCDPTTLVSNSYKIKWPPRSGNWATFPEVDRAEFFDLDTARKKVNPAQMGLLQELEQILREKQPSRA